MAECNSSHVANSSKTRLGFVEDIDKRLLLSKFFPSKVGGKPAWLSLDSLPEPESLQCDSCGGPMLFLLQVYAPLEKDATFHRTLFIFVCSKKTCISIDKNTNFKVFRSQLPLINSFYSKDPPNEDLDIEEDCSSFPHAGLYQSLCNVCGVKSSKKCSKCKKVVYCSKEHQSLDWKLEHKKKCDELLEAKGKVETGGNDEKMLFKEYDLVTEDEEVEDLKSSETKTDEERMEEYKMMTHLPKMSELEGKFKEEDLETAAVGETEDDKHFLYFKKKIGNEPSQVLRYSRGEEPLWVSAIHKPTPEDIPHCNCGAKRIFEFQVMPQLLNHLKVDSLDASLDWGTLCVYTCVESCSISNTYRQEFIWKQDFHGGGAAGEG